MGGVGGESPTGGGIFFSGTCISGMFSSRVPRSPSMYKKCLVLMGGGILFRKNAFFYGPLSRVHSSLHLALAGRPLRAEMEVLEIYDELVAFVNIVLFSDCINLSLIFFLCDVAPPVFLRARSTGGMGHQGVPPDVHLHRFPHPGTLSA